MKYALLISVFICSVFTAIGQKRKIVYGNNRSAGHYFKSRGIKIYYETYGKGRPLLLLHGNGGSMAAFKHQIPYFARHYHVIAVDSRAQGKSADPQDSLSYDMMADDFDALLDHLHVKSCDVIGWSDGGIDGLLLAIRHPDKVKALAVTGANLAPDSSAFGSKDYNDMLVEDARLKKLAVNPKGKHDYKLLHLMVVEPHLKPEDLKQIHCPTLVIGGDHDLIPTHHTMLIAESIPGAYLWILPDSGHDTLIKYKNDFNHRVDRFFREGK